MDPAAGVSWLAGSHESLARTSVIAALVISVTATTALAMDGPAALIAPQLYYLPILYAGYHYPRHGIWVAGACAVLYEIVAIRYTYPVALLTAFSIMQAVLFICIGAVVAQIREENLRLRRKIDSENERRRGVISTVAHELRTPLQPLMGYLNLLVQDAEQYRIVPDTREILNRCLSSVERERQIINRMLELSVLETGKIRPDYSVFSLPDLINTVISSGGYMTKAEITVDVPAGLAMEADAGKISSVLDSMLSNAVAYSRPPRRIRITYGTERTDPYHRLSIQDNGVGIAEQFQDTIFEPFQLADSGRLSRKYERIGLSLSIAKKYIEMHGGTITIQSVVNEGSTFTIRIPKVRPEGVVTGET